MDNPTPGLATNTPIPPKKTFSGVLIIFSLVCLGATGWFYYQNLTLKQLPTQTTIPVTTTSPQPSSSPSLWKTAKYASFFSYKYPVDWHVAELWQENYAENGIVLAIDPNPISTAPRGGPLATFEITLLSGNQNPDEILQKRMDTFNAENYSDITKETINAGIGTVYHYKGKVMGEMMKGASMESYFFTFHKNPNDMINQQVAIANLTFNEDPKLSEMLRHIVLSFKEI